MNMGGEDHSARLPLGSGCHPPYRRKNASSSRLIRRSTLFSGTAGWRLTQVLA
jgi:hypothetical protein